MSSKRKHQSERRLRVRGVRRQPPDSSRIARVLLELAQAQAEADAEAEHRASESSDKRSNGTEKGGAA
jgi:hypothetical protein